MEQYAIRGGNPLVGEVEIGGAKNAALAILAAAIMTDDICLVENIPDVRDTNVMLQAIESIGGTVNGIDRHTCELSGKNIIEQTIDNEYIKRIRASYYLLGALLGKYKRAQVTLPGGCNIGLRPIDQHIKGMRALGADRRPVPGLYAIGNTAGGRYGVDYPMLLPGNSHGTGLTFGYLLGRELAEK